MIKEEQVQMRRAQLLSIGLDLFIKKGFYGTSTREISRIAGISSGLMFHYFNTKEDLYENLVEIGCSKMSLIKADKETQLTDPRAFLQEILNDLFDMLKQNPGAAKMFVFINNSLHNKEISQKANDLLAQNDVVQLSIPVIRHGQLLKQLRSGDPLALSIAFWNAVQGIAQEIALHPEYPLPEPGWLMDIIELKGGFYEKRD